MSDRKRRAARPRRRRAYHHGDLRRALLDAALALIARGGVSALTLRAVARRAGVSHAAPAHHFVDLLGLLRALADESFEALRAHMLAAIEGAPDAQSALRRSGIAYVEFAVANPARFRAMFHPAIGDDAKPSTAQAAAYEVLLAGIRAVYGGRALGGHEAAELAFSAWAPMHGLAALAVDRQLEGKGLATTDPVKLAERLTARAQDPRRPSC
ncbi:MAG TPA: TetR/AcrR family transcriptional regulator [Myxococcota bacterium]|nr:TetR/AcrR family transcriptional regulator [Myxococcota bacterium]